jgi:hypothetical protein
MDDWRRGSTYADLAFYLAAHGDTEHVDRYLALADEIADQKPPTRTSRVGGRS